MTHPYVIAMRSEFDFLDRVLDLPDAEHIHLHRRPDGTWTAVAMERRTVAVVTGNLDVWVDVPASPEDGARD